MITIGRAMQSDKLKSFLGWLPVLENASGLVLHLAWRWELPDQLNFIPGKSSINGGLFHVQKLNTSAHHYNQRSCNAAQLKWKLKFAIVPQAWWDQVNLDPTMPQTHRLSHAEDSGVQHGFLQDSHEPQIDKSCKGQLRAIATRQQVSAD